MFHSCSVVKMYDERLKKDEINRRIIEKSDEYQTSTNDPK